MRTMVIAQQTDPFSRHMYVIAQLIMIFYTFITCEIEVEDTHLEGYGVL